MLLYKALRFLFASFISISILTLVSACVPLDSGSSSTTTGNSFPRLEFKDKAYYENIRTVRIYPDRGTLQDVVQPAVARLGNSSRLKLIFDELNENFRNYNLKIYHCNSDWTRSQLRDMEYLFEFNEFPVNTFDYSQNTVIPYTHYEVFLPEVKVSGNYLAIVYEGNNSEDIILSQRFMVYESDVKIIPQFKMPTATQLRRTHQQVDVRVNFGNLPSNNPMQEFKLVMRQNQRWDNSIQGLKPTNIDAIDNVLIYEHFNGENTFYGGNQFRFFDIRTITVTGQMVQKVSKGDDPMAFIDPGKSRLEEAYSQYSEINGQFVINSLDPGTTVREAQYVKVNFFLKSPKQDFPVYVIGAFNNWGFNPENRMEFDEELGGYQAQLLLKQGIYNYLFYGQGAPNPYLYEGSHFDAENDYEIFVYFREQGSIFERLVAYQNHNFNPLN